MFVTARCAGRVCPLMLLQTVMDIQSCNSKGVNLLFGLLPKGRFFSFAFLLDNFNLNGYNEYTNLIVPIKNYEAEKDYDFKLQRVGGRWKPILRL